MADTTLVYIVCGIWIMGAVVAVLVMGITEKQRQPHLVTDLPREISDWLTENNFQLKAVETAMVALGKRGIVFGPFAGFLRDGQAYRVVISPQGSEKRRVAWIKLEDADHIHERLIVIWDDEWRPSEPPADL